MLSCSTHLVAVALVLVLPPLEALQYVGMRTRHGLSAQTTAASARRALERVPLYVVNQRRTSLLTSRAEKLVRVHANTWISGTPDERPGSLRELITFPNRTATLEDSDFQLTFLIVI